ncbi:hypothetical protein, partial [Salipiger aestuarii]|uniref:hypothetical protein n=1 Tax=Salipiger aestuarii TaxID=568098 RepID=UPI001CC2A3D9
MRDWISLVRSGEKGIEEKPVRVLSCATNVFCRTATLSCDCIEIPSSHSQKQIGRIAITKPVDARCWSSLRYRRGSHTTGKTTKGPPEGDP